MHQLTQQREQLLQQVQEEKLRWDAERDLWARTSEALLVKRRVGVEALHLGVRFYYIQLICARLTQRVH